MTLPIIPGPFSFLESAGGAAGSIGTAITERRRYEQALQMQNQQQAMQQILLLGKIGAPPEAYMDPQNAGLFAKAGVPQPTRIDVPYETQKGRRAGQELQNIAPGSTQSQMAAGVTTGPEAKIQEATGARADLDLRAISDLAKTATPQQLRALAKIVPAEFAAEAEKLALLKQKTETVQQDEQTSESRAKANIWKSVRARLPKDKTFNTIADYAAIGGLGYLTAQMQVQFGRQSMNTEKIRAFANVNDKAYRVYTEAFKTWHDQLEAAMKIAHAGEYLEMTPSEQIEVDNRVRKAHEDANGKEPRFEFFKKEALDAQGMAEEEWDQIGRELFKIDQQPGKGNPFEKAKAARKAGKITDAHIDEAFSKGEINAQQKAELKAIKPGSTPDE